MYIFSTGVENNVDPDQIASKQSDQDQHCFQKLKKMGSGGQGFKV